MRSVTLSADTGTLGDESRAHVCGADPSNNQAEKRCHVARRLFTSESVTEGHPDKMADQISDAILDAMLKGDPRSRVAVETLITTGQVHVAGEVTTETYVDIPGIIREKILEIGYDSSAKGFDGASCGVSGVDRLAVAGHRPGRGGEAVRAPRGRGRRRTRPAGRWRPGPDVRLRLPGHPGADAAADHAGAPAGPAACPRCAEAATIPYIRPDGKTQVTIEYAGDRPVRLDTVVVSTQHAPGDRPGRRC